MTKTEILSNIGVGSGINTTELIKALVDADSLPLKKKTLIILKKKQKIKFQLLVFLKVI